MKSVKFGRRDIGDRKEAPSARHGGSTTGTATRFARGRFPTGRERHLVLTEPMPGAVRKGTPIAV